MLKDEVIPRTLFSMRAQSIGMSVVGWTDKSIAIFRSAAKCSTVICIVELAKALNFAE